MMHKIRIKCTLNMKNLDGKDDKRRSNTGVLTNSN